MLLYLVLAFINTTAYLHYSMSVFLLLLISNVCYYEVGWPHLGFWSYFRGMFRLTYLSFARLFERPYGNNL